jgi:phospholipase/carboxylesterase
VGFLKTILIVSCIGLSSAACSSNRPASDVSTETGSALKPSDLTYVEFFTDGASPTEPAPMLIAVHGMGDRPESFKELFGDLKKPFRVVLPRAPKPYLSGFSWFDIRFPISESAEELGPGIRTASDQVAALIVKLTKNSYGKAKPVITGFSQGGAISYAVAAEHPSLIAAAVPLSGAIPPSLYPKKTDNPPPVCAAHGDQDELIPIEGARQSVQAFQAAGGKARLKEMKGLGHAVDDRMRAFLFARIQDCSRTESFGN